MTAQTILQASHFIELGDYQLHIRHIFPANKTSSDPSLLPLLFVHGSIENGRIFYTSSGKGLACQLAKLGFDCFVLDLRGRGESTPAIKPGATYGQHESICQELPAFSEYVRQVNPEKQVWISHSWGGVLVNAMLLRLPDIKGHCAGMVSFGSKRQLTALGIKRLFIIELIWRCLLPVAASLKGYADCKRWRIGSDNETRQMLADSSAWLRSEKWLDTKDDFDYLAAAQRAELPQALYYSAVNDRVLGHADDVERLAKQSQHISYQHIKLGRVFDCSHDYDHINMLTHPDSFADVKRSLLPFINGLCLAEQV